MRPSRGGEHHGRRPARRAARRRSLRRSADVLDRGRAGGAGDARQALQPAEALVDRARHKGVPLHARVGGRERAPVVGAELDSTGRDRDDGSAEPFVGDGEVGDLPITRTAVPASSQVSRATTIASVVVAVMSECAGPPSRRVVISAMRARSRHMTLAHPLSRARCDGMVGMATKLEHTVSPYPFSTDRLWEVVTTEQYWRDLLDAMNHDKVCWSRFRMTATPSP